MSETNRHILAQQQAQMVRALTLGHDGPVGIDAAQIRRTADSLAKKRRRMIARVWPGLARVLGSDFVRVCDAYVISHPLHADEKGSEDGIGFARYLLESNDSELTDTARIVCMRVATSRSLVGMIRARLDGRAVLGIRLPVLGMQIVRLPRCFAAARVL